MSLGKQVLTILLVMMQSEIGLVKYFLKIFD